MIRKQHLLHSVVLFCKGWKRERVLWSSAWGGWGLGRRKGRLGFRVCGRERGEEGSEIHKMRLKQGREHLRAGGKNKWEFTRGKRARGGGGSKRPSSRRQKLKPTHCRNQTWFSGRRRKGPGRANDQESIENTRRRLRKGGSLV